MTTAAALHPRLAAMLCFQSMIMGAQAMLLTPSPRVPASPGPRWP